MDILILGDSIAKGKGVPGGKSWCEFISNFTNTYNFSQCGATSSDVKEKIDRIIGREVNIIALGINDSKVDKISKTPFSSEETFISNMTIIIQSIRKREPLGKLLIQGITNVSEERVNGPRFTYDYLNEKIETYNESLRNLSERLGVKFIPIALEETDLGNDGLHPNAAGHLKIYNAIIKEIGIL